MEIWLIAAVVVTAAVAIYALLNRRRGEVIDSPPRPAQPVGADPAVAPSQTTEIQDLSAGDMLKAERADEPLQHFADWLEGEASEELGEAAEAPGPTRRIADAARAVMPVILAQGRGVVDLPGLVVDASGGRDFRREIDIAGLERAVADTGLFDVHELCTWRGDSPEVRALAASLDDQRFYDMPGDYAMTAGDAFRIVEAARQAVAEIDRTSRADIALPAIGKNDEGQTFDIRRSVDAQTLRTIVTEFEAAERVTTRTRARPR